MKKLYQLVTIVSNTEDAVVLKVKPGSEVDLICLGCFTGEETMMRLTKGKNITCTVWTKKGSNYSWEWGDGGHTLVSDNMSKRGKMIQQCIEDNFDILVYGSRQSIIKDMNRRNKRHTLSLWENGIGCACRKDDEFLRYFASITTAVNHFKESGYEVTEVETRVSDCTGYTVHEYIIIKL